MNNLSQRREQDKQVSIWLVAVLLVMAAAFFKGAVNVHAEEGDDITVIKYINGKQVYQDEEGEAYTVGDSINLSVKVEGISDTTNLKYQWKYAGEVVSESIGGRESSVTIVKKCGENDIDCEISNGEEEIAWTSFTVESTETLNMSKPELFVDGQEVIEATREDEFYYSWDDDIDLTVGQQLKIKLNVKSNYGSISYKWSEEEGDISNEDGGNTDTIVVKKKKTGQEKYYCVVTDGNEKESVKIIIPEVKTLTTVRKVNGEVCDSNIEGIRGEKYILEVEAQSTNKDENGKENITYQWYTNVSGEEVEIEGETKSTLEVEVQTKIRSYICKVFDGHSRKEIWFSVDIKETLSSICTVLFEGEEYYPGSSCLLSIPRGTEVRLTNHAQSSLGTVNYQWYDSKKIAIPASEGGNTSTINVKKSIQGEETYYCTVSDGNMEEEEFITLGAEDTLKFKSQINGRENTSSEENFIAKEGEKVTLSIVDAVTSYDQGVITYEWFEGSEPLDNNSSTLEITKKADEEKYVCAISDGNITHTVHFWLATQGCNHKWQINEEKKATCTEDGEIEYICEYCEKYRSENIPALGHNWDTGTITKKPTVTEKGIKTYRCKNSGCKETKTEEIEKLTQTQKPSTENPKKDTGKQALKVGTKVTDKKSKATYKVTGKNTVEYTKPSTKNIKTLTIPSSITINKTKYQVTSIAAKAMKNNSKLKKLTIPASIKKIGAQAFCGCKNLKTITVKTAALTQKSVGAKAFKGINAKAVIKVPKKQLKAYQKLLKARGTGNKVTIKK